jgi:hypothetical protein
MKKMVLNERLLRQVQTHIRDNDVCFHYIKGFHSDDPVSGKEMVTLEGLVCLIHDGKPCPKAEVEGRAAKLLKIEHNQNRNFTEADRLFYPSMFPEPFRARFTIARGDRARANVYVDWIEEFIIMKNAGTFPPSSESKGENAPTPGTIVWVKIPLLTRIKNALVAGWKA